VLRKIEVEAIKDVSILLEIENAVLRLFIIPRQRNAHRFMSTGVHL
jgi:hypothetical protein